MADNLCGPSNALQNFQKHSTVDRTLQQDRLVHRPSPSQVCPTLCLPFSLSLHKANIFFQGFRSSPGPNAGLLDPEFEAFQAGRFPLESQSFQPQGFSYAPPPQQAGPSWANDFQQLNISGPHHQLQQQPLGQQAQPRHDTAGWHQDFAQQFAGLGKSVASDPRSAQMAGRSVPMYMQQNNGVSMYQNSFQPQQSAMAQQDQRAEELFDEEAFERAFQEAAESEQELTQKEQIELGQDIMIAESVDRLVNDQPPVDQVRLGADLIHDPSSESRNSPQEQEDPDALARTAAQLLDSVRHNQSNKFQNSQFLELMRQLRDREVMVEGDKIVGGGSSNGTTTGWDMEMMSDEAVKVAAPP